MRRYACVFLPYWPIERNATRPDRPVVIVTSASGGWRIAAANRRAEMLGVMSGELLADVRARLGVLDVREAEPDADRQALEKLATWAACFSPHVAPWAGPVHGLTFDIEGCAHLFGGEERMVRHMDERLSRFGLTARIAIASTIGAAQALCRFGTRESVVAAGKEAEALSRLPVAALRISERQAASLIRLGLKRIADVAHLPRAPLAQRFGADFVERLDQAFGCLPEPFSPLVAPVAYRALARLAEPIMAQDHVLDLTRRLAQDLMPTLMRNGKGARTLRLTLYRVDGEIKETVVNLAAASRDVVHIVNLFSLKLDALTEEYDAGFGFEAARLDALECETLPVGQATLAVERQADNLPFLIDRLGSRLGLENIVRLKLNDTHIPEHAVAYAPALDRSDWSGQDDLLRPLLILPCAEPAEVTALMPDGPPRRFRWRGVSYGVALSEGPERIRPEWWRRQQRPRTRDYYTVEDEAGHRFWLYREMMEEGDDHPRWFMHGVFA
ncbi:MAG: DNA polymerase Y family protein [Alphaproteobacteria bacterium]|nr:DNA polymerase Y family protein [Alphaproteobacteria bacterium]